MIYYNERLDTLAIVWELNPSVLTISENGNVRYVLTKEWQFVGELN